MLTLACALLGAFCPPFCPGPDPGTGDGCVKSKAPCAAGQCGVQSCDLPSNYCKGGLPACDCHSCKFCCCTGCWQPFSYDMYNCQPDGSCIKATESTITLNSSSLDLCTKSCQAPTPPPTATYKCEDQASCVKDPSGTQTLAQCQAQCPPPSAPL